METLNYLFTLTTIDFYTLLNYNNSSNELNQTLFDVNKAKTIKIIFFLF